MTTWRIPPSVLSVLEHQLGFRWPGSPPYEPNGWECRRGHADGLAMWTELVVPDPAWAVAAYCGTCRRDGATDYAEVLIIYDVAPADARVANLDHPQIRGVISEQGWSRIGSVGWECPRRHTTPAAGVHLLIDQRDQRELTLLFLCSECGREFPGEGAMTRVLATPPSSSWARE